MKHMEVTFTNLSFGNLADLTVAKFNKIHEKLNFCSDDKLLNYQRKYQTIREEHIAEEQEQADFRQREAERQLALVRLKSKGGYNYLKFFHRRLQNLIKLTKLLES